jgi:hypothetical protein
MSQEQWRPLPGWEGFYEVSDAGRIWRFERIIHGHWSPSQVMKPFAGSHGYLYVYLSRPGRRRSAPVAATVLEAFFGPRPDGFQCCHNNGIKTDNRIDNLRWDEPVGNAMDRVWHGDNPGSPIPEVDRLVAAVIERWRGVDAPGRIRSRRNQ